MFVPPSDNGNLPGPPRVKNGQGPEILSELTPHYYPELDAGAFWVVWEVVEARCKRTVEGMMGSEGAAAYQRARDAMREAYWGKNPALLEAMKPKAPAKKVPPPVKKVVRTIPVKAVKKQPAKKI